METLTEHLEALSEPFQVETLKDLEVHKELEHLYWQDLRHSQD